MTFSFSEWGGRTEQIGRYADSADIRWSLFNPCIGWSPEDGYLISFRSSNYYLQTDGSVMVTDGYQVKNRVYLQKLDDDLTLLDSLDKLLVSSYTFDGVTNPLKRGIEDVRIFWRPEGWKFCGVVFEAENGVKIPRMAIGSLDSPEVCTLLDGIAGMSEKMPEKNWTPVGYGGSNEFDFIYKTNHVIQNNKILKVGPDIPELSQLHGGPPLAPFDDGTFLGVPHIVQQSKVRVYNPSRMAYIDGIQRHYEHRFVRYEASGAVVEASEPFVFDRGGVEFCAGLVQHGYDFVMSYGRNDVSSFLGRIEERKVKKLLKKV